MYSCFHSVGLPARSLVECVDLVADAGYDAIELNAETLPWAPAHITPETGSAERKAVVEAKNQADIARREGVSRVRVTQIMGMLRLAPEIQQHVLSMPEMLRWPVITERALRSIARLENIIDQKARFQKLIAEGQ